MDKKIFITSTTVNSKMWVRERVVVRADRATLDKLKEEISKENVVFVNILDNKALVNYLNEQGVEVKYQEKPEFIHADYDDIIYEIFCIIPGNKPMREVKTDEALPKFTNVYIRRHEIKDN